MLFGGPPQNRSRPEGRLVKLIESWTYLRLRKVNNATMPRPAKAKMDGSGIATA